MVCKEPEEEPRDRIILLLQKQLQTQKINSSGPKGMDKMLVDSMGDVVITNDGATILKEMDIEHPKAAKMIIEVAKTQEQHCFDGTTTAVVLSGELLKRSEDLIEQNVHPTVICEGFRLAAEKAVNLLESLRIETKNVDDVLMEVAKTALTGKSAGAGKVIYGGYLCALSQCRWDN